MFAGTAGIAELLWSVGPTATALAAVAVSPGTAPTGPTAEFVAVERLEE